MNHLYRAAEKWIVDKADLMKMQPLWPKQSTLRPEFRDAVMDLIFTSPMSSTARAKREFVLPKDTFSYPNLPTELALSITNLTPDHLVPINKKIVSYRLMNSFQTSVLHPAATPLANLLMAHDWSRSNGSTLSFATDLGPLGNLSRQTALMSARYFAELPPARFRPYAVKLLNLDQGEAEIYTTLLADAEPKPGFLDRVETVKLALKQAAAV